MPAATRAERKVCKRSASGRLLASGGLGGDHDLKVDHVAEPLGREVKPINPAGVDFLKRKPSFKDQGMVR